MSFTLFKMTFKKNLMLGIIFLAVMIMYSVVMISMFSPESLDALNAMFKVLPPEMMKAFGFNGAFDSLVGYLASWLYGLILTAFPMVYCILLGHKLVCKTVDSGSIACLLATPHSRTKLIITKGVYALLSMAIMQMFVFGINLLIAKVMFPAETIDVYVFLKLNVTVMLVNLTAMSITFFCSCLFNDTRFSVGFGAGIPIAFLLFNMLGNASKDAEFLKKCSIYGWYDPVGIANGDATLTVNLIYCGIILILFIGSIFVFRKKRLPI
ncbi:MAG: ABC transporter permease subunit [Cellulosilyticaceae bacterium]